MTPEARVKNEVKKALKAIGAYQHWPVQNGMGAPCLDCHGCYKGLYFAIETKAPGKLPTPRQEQTIANIVAAGGYAMVISSIEGAQKIPTVMENWYYAKGRNLDRRGEIGTA